MRYQELDEMILKPKKITLCKWEGCNARTHAKGFCHKHYDKDKAMRKKRETKD